VTVTDYAKCFDIIRLKDLINICKIVTRITNFCDSIPKLNSTGVSFADKKGKKLSFIFKICIN